jgi:hypothetical protein
MADSLTLIDHSRGGARFLHFGRIALGAELLAFGLLKAGFRIGPSFGLACTAAAVLLTWRRLLRGAGALVRYVALSAVAIGRRIFSRDTYRFRLSTLLLAIACIAAVCAWYGDRLHEVRLEKRRLAGKWRMLNLNGAPLVFRGKPVIEDFEQAFRAGTCTIDPSHDPKWIDFHGPTGTSRGIYAWETGRVRLRQASENSLRPASFDPQAAAGPGGISQLSRSDWLLERVTEAP